MKTSFPISGKPNKKYSTGKGKNLFDSVKNNSYDGLNITEKNINDVDEKGNTIIQYCIQTRNYDVSCNLLKYPNDLTKLSAIKYEDQDDNFPYTNGSLEYKYTPLHYLFIKRNIDHLKLFLFYNGSIDIKDSNGFSVRDYYQAIKNGQYHLVYKNYIYSTVIKDISEICKTKDYDKCYGDNYFLYQHKLEEWINITHVDKFMSKFESSLLMIDQMKTISNEANYLSYNRQYRQSCDKYLELIKLIQIYIADTDIIILMVVYFDHIVYLYKKAYNILQNLDDKNIDDKLKMVEIFKEFVNYRESLIEKIKLKAPEQGVTINSQITTDDDNSIIHFIINFVTRADNERKCFSKMKRGLSMYYDHEKLLESIVFNKNIDVKMRISLSQELVSLYHRLQRIYHFNDEPDEYFSKLASLYNYLFGIADNENDKSEYQYKYCEYLGMLSKSFH